jgi:hypothetical protein
MMLRHPRRPMTDSRAKWPVPEDWAKHRRLIRQLYLHEDRPLNEVMEIMQRDYEFKATYVVLMNSLTEG